MRTKLEKAVTKRVLVTHTTKAALYAVACDSCGRVFEMRSYCNDRPSSADVDEDERALNADPRFRAWLQRNQYRRDDPLGTLTGMFSPYASREGNMFRAHVCSFACAHDLVEGGWRKMADYKAQVEAGAELVRAHLSLTRGPLLIDEATLRREWEERSDAPVGGYINLV